MLTKYKHQGQSNSEALRNQECTHMNDIADHLCPDFKKTNKQTNKQKMTLPIFRPKGQTNLLFF